MKKVLYIMIASSIAFYAGQASANDQQDPGCKLKNVKKEMRNNNTNRGLAKASSKTRASETLRGKSS